MRFGGRPSGWRFESHRHSLAAKGVKTAYFMKKEYVVDVPKRDAASVRKDVDALEQNLLEKEKDLYAITQDDVSELKMQLKDVRKKVDALKRDKVDE